MNVNPRPLCFCGVPFPRAWNPLVVRYLGEIAGQLFFTEVSVAADIPSDVIAAQFAGGMSIARLAREWELRPEEVELALRHQMRLLIPRWAGGLKPTRDEMRKAREREGQRVQGLFEGEADDE